MKRYKQLFKEEDSLSNLKDESLPKKIKDFFIENPFPTDHGQFHSWAEKLGFKEASELEEYVYAILTIVFNGGVSEGKGVEVSKENLDIGMQIELEHFKYDTDNKVVKSIIELLARKVVNDHISENPNYYIDGVASFKDELKQEGK